MPTYNGTANWDVFEAFSGKWDSWQRSRELNDASAVTVLQHALTGSAAEWYNKHVALNTRRWSVERLFNDLFEAVFPENFREDLRERLMSAAQRGTPRQGFC